MLLVPDDPRLTGTFLGGVLVGSLGAAELCTLCAALEAVGKRDDTLLYMYVAGGGGGGGVIQRNVLYFKSMMALLTFRMLSLWLVTGDTVFLLNLSSQSFFPNCLTPQSCYYITPCEW